MKTIDIHGDNYIEPYTNVREACRGILIVDGKILLTYETNTDQWFIPGGGLEDSESIAECCVRELAEETGIVVDTKQQFLTINEYYDDWLFISHYYTCEYMGETKKVLTGREIEVGLEPRWISLDEAIEIFSKYQDYAGKDEMKSGAYLREYKALMEWKNL